MRSPILRRLAQRLAPLLNDATCTPLLSGGRARLPAADQRSLPLLVCHAHASTQSAHLAGCALSCEHDLRDDRHTEFAQRPVVLVQPGHPWSAGRSAGALKAPLDGCACPVARYREDRQPHAAQMRAHVEQLGDPWSAGRTARALAAVMPAAHGGADAHTLAQAGLGTVRGFSDTSHTDCRGLAVGAPVQCQAPASREAQQSTASTGTLQSGTVHADSGPAGHEKGNALPAAQVWGPPLSTSCSRCELTDTCTTGGLSCFLTLCCTRGVCNTSNLDPLWLAFHSSRGFTPALPLLTRTLAHRLRGWRLRGWLHGTPGSTCPTPSRRHALSAALVCRALQDACTMHACCTYVLVPL